MPGINVVAYDSGRKNEWDRFIAQSKNGLFLFYRDYMDYHSDRFPDGSLMFFDDRDVLIAVLPATRNGSTLSSHSGLTFGGVVSDTNMKAPQMLSLFAALIAYADGSGIETIVYKPVPHIYHAMPAEEDLYALYRCNARLVRREVSSAISLADRLSFSKGRLWGLKQAQKAGVCVRMSDDYATFMAIEAYVLGTKYDLTPVHTAEEMALLASRFPENIRLFGAFRGDTMLAGVVMYESRYVAHSQYSAATDEGKRLRALDLVIGQLLDEHYAHKRCFDFGISTEDHGRYLNEGLIWNKESFGARSIVHDRYEISVAGT